jgi:ferrous iron transport protein A
MVMFNKLIAKACNRIKGSKVKPTNLAHAELDVEYTIKAVVTDDAELKNFLFTLGCYAGESVTVISILAENYVINVKDARYSIDRGLAEAIAI